MKSCVFFGFLIAAFLQAKCESTNKEDSSIIEDTKKFNIQLKYNNAVTMCGKKVGIERMPKNEFEFNKIYGCTFQELGFINEYGELSKHRMEDYFVDSYQLPRINVHNRMRECVTNRDKLYNAIAVNKIIDCLSQSIN